MKSVMLSIKPYWLFLIIAKKMGWKTDKEKTIEVRKSYPKDKDWNKTIILYCTKDKISFNLIPKEYRQLMEMFLGKVIGEFVCNEIKEIRADNLVALYFNNPCDKTCLGDLQLRIYANGNNLFLWHTSDLKIYDEPKALGKFYRYGSLSYDDWLYGIYNGKGGSRSSYESYKNVFKLIYPPQSWCYVEELICPF